MKKRTMISVGLASILALGAATAYANDVPNTPENRAREAAKQGPEALRHFMHRTRMIYNLYFFDFVQHDD